MSEEIKVWGIHTYDDNLFLKENVIAIGWEEIRIMSRQLTSVLYVRMTR